MNNFIEKLKSRSPLIHNITNMVTINDVANIELACGVRPIMAMAPQEMDEVTGICDGLNLNRSEERRVGKECSEPCRSRWSPYH